MSGYRLIALVLVIFQTTFSLAQGNREPLPGSTIPTSEKNNSEKKFLVIFALDQSGSSLRLLFPKDAAPNYSLVLGQQNGRLRSWLDSKLDISDWNEVHTHIFSYGFDSLDSWKHDYLRHYNSRIDNPFRALHLLEYEIQEPFDYGLSTATLPMVLQATASEVTNNFDQIYVVQLHDGKLNLSATNLDSPEVENAQRSQYFQDYDFYKKALKAVSSHYRVEILGKEDMFSYGGRSYQANLYRVTPAQTVDLSSCFELVTTPAWEPTRAGYELSFPFRQKSLPPGYVIHSPEVYLKKGVRLFTATVTAEDRKTYRASLTHSTRDPSSLPDSVVIEAMLLFAPADLDLGLKQYGTYQIPTTVVHTDPITIGLPLPGLSETISVWEAMEMFPNMSLSEIRKYLDALRTRQMGALFGGTIMILLIAGLTIYTRRRSFPPAILTMDFVLDKRRVSEPDEEGIFHLTPIQLDHFDPEARISLGTLILKDEGRPNKMGHYAPVEIESLVTQLSGKNQDDLESGPRLCTVKGLELGPESQFYRERTYQLVLNMGELRNIDEIDLPNGEISLELDLELRMKRPGKPAKSFSTTLCFRLPIEPATYRGHPEWEPYSDSGELEFAGDSEDADWLGQIIITDDTAYHYRRETSITLEYHLYQLSDDLPRKLPNTVLNLEAEEHAIKAHSGLAIENRLIQGDLIFPVSVNFDRLEPVTAPTSYKIHIRAMIDGHESTIETIFKLTPNRKVPQLCGSLKHHLGGSRNYSLPDLGEGLDLRTSGRITQSPEQAIRLVTLELWNAAAVDLPDDRNTILIEEISLIDEPTLSQEEPLLGLRILAGNRIESRLSEPIRLVGGPGRRLEIQVMAHPNLPDSAFETEFQTWILHLVYRQPGGEHPQELTCPITIAVSMDLGSEVVAIDFGTSALAIADATFENNQPEVRILNLKRRWRELQEEQSTAIPYESAENLLTSTLKRADLHGEDIFVMGHTITDFTLHADKLVPYLKSHIGGCRHLYNLDGEEYSISELIAHAYTDIYHRYVMHGRRGKRFKRMVLTHPNSYLDGQIHFLSKRIRELIPHTFDLLTMSESDAVIYQHLEARKRDPQLAALSEGREKEYILCFDMGAGTVDLSLRRLDHRGKNSMEKSAITQLLSMVSVNGAGNLMDEIIALEVDRALDQLYERYRRLVEKGKAREQKMRFLSWARKDPNPAEWDTQKKALLFLREAVKEAKKSLLPGESVMILTMPIQEDATQRSYFWISEGVRVQICPDPEELPYIQPFADGAFRLKLCMKQLWQRIEAEYLPSQVYRPLDAALAGIENTHFPVDTLVISGRAALFPGIREVIVAYIDEKTGKRPRCCEVADMKTCVISGALQWGIHNTYQTEWFKTPSFHGTIGIALKYAGTWRWYPMLHDISPEQSPANRRRESPLVDVTQCVQLLVLHTPIQNPDLVMEYLNKVHALEVHVLKSHLEQTGMFRVLHGFHRFPSMYDYEQVSFHLVPIFYEDGDIYGPCDPETDYLNVRVQLEAHGKHGQIKEMENSDAVTSSPLFFSDNWPEKIFASKDRSAVIS